MTHPIVDLTIIGGGPTGLYAAFYAGMRAMTAQIVDALPQLGGQLTALYPHKYIYDVAGFPRVLAKDLVKSLTEQAARWNFPCHLNQRIIALREVKVGDSRHFLLEAEGGVFPTRAVLVAAGIGAFTPRRLPQACAAPWYGRGVYDVVGDPDEYRGQRVLIIGGGDTAFDWATQLLGRAAHVTVAPTAPIASDPTAPLWPRSPRRSPPEGHRCSRSTSSTTSSVRNGGDRLTHVVLRDNRTTAMREMSVDVVLPLLGFVSDLGPLREWGLTLDGDEIVVSSEMATDRPGVYAAGDITSYPGKLKLIVSGFSEAATAVNQAVHWVHPEKKVSPGHSSNLAVFGQEEQA